MFVSLLILIPVSCAFDFLFIIWARPCNSSYHIFYSGNSASVIQHTVILGHGLMGNAQPQQAGDQ
ncbi:hypothetical protein ACJX0J_030319, partial [Zea mays]